MKNIIKYLLVFLGISFATAQGSAKFGITGGLLNNNTDIDISAFGLFDITSIDAINETGFYIGAFVDIEATEKLHIQPELLYGSAGDLSFFYLPIMAKYYVAERLNLQIGPQLSFSTNLNDIKAAIQDIEGVLGTNANLDDVLESTGVDLSFGLGFDVNEQFFVQARYALELSDRYSGPLKNALDIKPSTFIFGIGYSFN
jgi:opacity protein-like surface antigen